MKSTFISSLLVAFIIGGTNAYADDRRYDRGYRGHHKPSPSVPRYRGHHRSRYYAPRYRNYDDDDDDAAYFIGGLFLGTILYDVFARPPSNDIVYIERNRVPSSRITYSETIPGRRLLRDINGNCFNITRDDNGNELRTELPASECNW